MDRRSLLKYKYSSSEDFALLTTLLIVMTIYRVYDSCCKANRTEKRGQKISFLVFY